MRDALRSIFTAALLLMVTFAAGCTNDDDGHEVDDDVDPTAHTVIKAGMNDYVNGSNEFSFDMYRELVDSDDNVFFSPYSIAIALGMAYEGARGTTAEEMQTVIELPEDDDARHDMVRSLQSQLNKEGVSYDLSTANAYWVREGAHLEQEYMDAIEDYYLAGGQQLDFAGDAEGSADTINEWVEDETNDRIKDLIPPDLIDPMTYLILTNAIYFMSDWKYQFDAEATEGLAFHMSDGSSKTTDTMRMCDKEKELNYAGNSEAQLLQLPYKDEELSMYVLLPRENDIAALEGMIDRQYVSGLKDDLASEYVDLYLPKFTFEMSFKLSETLKSMGMPTAFGMSANFSGMTGDDSLYIDEVLHKSFVEVNEKGTEAAAATAVIMQEKIGGGGSTTPQPIEFRADHPFIFFIEHRDSGQILFMGKVEDPGAGVE